MVQPSRLSRRIAQRTTTGAERDRRRDPPPPRRMSPPNTTTDLTLRRLSSTARTFRTMSKSTERVAERRRAVALARHYRQAEDLPIAQIAQRLGRSPATIKGYFYDPLMLAKDLGIAPRANAGLGATRAAYDVSPGHRVPPGPSRAELTPPWPGGTALRPIPAGARPYAGALHARVRVGRPGAAPVWHAQADSAAACRLVSTEAPDARASRRYEARASRAPAGSVGSPHPPVG